MSAWNDFQKACAGKGMSRSEVSAAYQASKSSGGGGGSSSSSYSTPSYSSSSYSRPSYSRPSYSPPPPAPTPAPASRGPSEWNQFQHAHAGQGLSRSEVAALYQTRNSTSSNASSSSSSSSARQSAAATTSSSSSSNSWNQYQRDHAGLGLTRAELSSGYQAQKAVASSSSSASQATSSSTAKRNAAADAATTRAAAAAKPTQAAPKPKAPAATAVGSPLTWNDFQRQQAGEGYSKRQISLLYKEHKATTTGSATQSTSTATSAATRTTSRAASSDADSTTKPARRPNAFNEFQKQYKKDHPNEKLTTPKLAKLYRQQQQQELHESHNERLVSELFRDNSGGFGGFDHDDYGSDAYNDSQDFGGDYNGNSNAFSDAQEQLLTDARHLIESMMLEMTQRMDELRQQSASMEEIEEAARVVHELEAEEGNLNRKAFVDAHEPQFVLTMSKGDLNAHAKHVASLCHCEVIDESRLNLAMDDESRIGSGGCGVVYAAMLDSDTPVAVKVVDGVNTKSKELFEQEMLAMMKASAHENVLRVLGYSVFTDNGGRQSFGIVMELMGGGDLANFMHRDETVSVTQKDLLQKLLQVIKAIEYIHAQGITHRDIKPHNVLLSGDLKTAKLADFGLAGYKNATMSTRQSRAGSAAGVMGLTPAYAAPEVIEGKLSFRDAAWKKSDVFSFTVLLTEAVMREQPWEFETPQFIMNSVSKQQKRPFDEDELSLSDSSTATAKLRTLVRDGWHQDPSVRPTATEMRERLEKIVADVEAASPASSEDGARSSAGSSPRGVDAPVASVNPYSYLTQSAARTETPAPPPSTTATFSTTPSKAHWLVV